MKIFERYKKRFMEWWNKSNSLQQAMFLIASYWLALWLGINFIRILFRVFGTGS